MRSHTPFNFTYFYFALTLPHAIPFSHIYIDCGGGDPGNSAIPIGGVQNTAYGRGFVDDPELRGTLSLSLLILLSLSLSLFLSLSIRFVFVAVVLLSHSLSPSLSLSVAPVRRRGIQTLDEDRAKRPVGGNRGDAYQGGPAAEGIGGVTGVCVYICVCLCS